MAPPAKYPRATVRALVKAHASKRVAREVDALVYLNYVLFLEQYVKLNGEIGNTDAMQTDEERGAQE